MTKILVVHGAGMNMRGKVQLERFSPMLLSDYDKKIQQYASELGVTVDIFHSNIEGEVINKFYEAHDGGIDAALINPAGYSTGRPALEAAIGQVRFPTLEIHVSNPAAHGSVSKIAPVCRGVITGFGIMVTISACEARSTSLGATRLTSGSIMPVASGTLMDKNSLALSPLRQALRSGGVRRYSTKGVGQYRL